MNQLNDLVNRFCHFGSLVGASSGSLGALLDPLGAPLGSLGAPLERLVALLGSSLRASWAREAS